MNKETLKNLAIKSFDNAVELLEEAKLLLKNEHYPRTVFLSQIGSEELGKHIMSLSGYVNIHIGKFDEKEFMSHFFAHREKTKSINVFEDFFLDIFNDRNFSDEDLKKRFAEYVPQVNLEEKGKLLSLYVDFIDNQVSMPSELITEELAKLALNHLENRINLLNKLGGIHILKNEKDLEILLEKTTESLKEFGIKSA